MGTIDIYFGTNRANPVYYFHAGKYYDFRGDSYTVSLSFAEHTIEIDESPDLSGFDMISVTEKLRYAPILANVPQGAAIYLDNTQKFSALPNKSYQNYTNWYLKLLIPSIFQGGLRFREGTMNPGLKFELNMYPQILLKALGGIPVFYDTGTRVSGDLTLKFEDSELRFSNLPGETELAPVMASNFPKYFPWAQYLYFDNLNRKCVIVGSRMEILRIQKDGRLVPNRLNPQDALLTGMGPAVSLASDPDLVYYQNLNRDILAPLLRQGIQTGAGYDNYKRALDLVEIITKEQQSLALVEADYRNRLAVLTKQIEEYNRLRGTL